MKYAGVVELVDTLDLGSSAVRCESSSLSACTTRESRLLGVGFFCFGKTMLKQIEVLWDQEQFLGIWDIYLNNGASLNVKNSKFLFFFSTGINN